MVLVAAVLPVLGGKAISAQDKYTEQVPSGLAFSDFRGYEDWQVVAVSKTDELMAAILANPVMIAAYREGVPGNGKPFPDGSKIAKIHWKPKTSVDTPAPTTVPDILHDVDFIERDSKKFPDSGGWGYAQFNYDAASDTFAPEGSGSNCGYSCHTIVAAKDYIFTAYPKR
ncbi:MAG: cytochrome P460 family protein [Bradyrhizobium sp.]